MQACRLCQLAASALKHSDDVSASPSLHSLSQLLQVVGPVWWARAPCAARRAAMHGRLAGLLGLRTLHALYSLLLRFTTCQLTELTDFSCSLSLLALLSSITQRRLPAAALP